MATTTVHRLKVTLRGVKPPVWRRIEVASDTKLSDLAGMLEGAMGWLGGHLHAFEAEDATYELPNEDSIGFRRTVDERMVMLADVLSTVSSKMRWDYDFGDGWQHDVVVEAIEPAGEGTEDPVCIGGRRACPPEDCGGPWGYGNLLAAMRDPTGAEHEELVEWVPPGFDPAKFDVAEATEAMRTPRPPMDW